MKKVFFTGSIKSIFRKSEVRNPKRYRLDFIKENTFNRLWSIRMTRSRVWLFSIAFFAGVGALIYVIFAFTPMRRLLPMKMEKATRAGYLEASMRLDSLERAVEISRQYVDKVNAILDGEPVSDSISAPTFFSPDSSLMAAREAEKRFVKEYEDERRFNLSVLAPIAAGGMDFASPVGALAMHTRSVDEGKAVEISTGRATPAASIYKGTVVALTRDSEGLATIVVQHPGGFISVYGGLREVFVERGQTVERAQRLGHAAPPGGNVRFELWHNGSALNPEEYI